ncbi:MAG TPA: T9SS type A sorting domain-containing protein, partial [Bacteroidia bacterium]|nr:T9SS type A sorting domain-containing protein [Bacteroidia bacterium]
SSYNHIGRKTSEFDLLHIKATSPEKVSDEIYLWFNKYSADNKFDKLDGLKLLNAPESPSIYTLTADGKKAVFNVMKEITDNYHSVEMPFTSTTKGSFSLEFTFENPDQVETITLEDRKTGTFSDVLANTTYTFEHDGSTKMKERFVLHFQRKGGTTAIEDYLAETQPVQISTDSRNIMVRFPVIKQNGAQITVYDMLGRQVMETRRVDTNSELYIIDGSSLSSGYYTVKVQAGNEVKTAPVFITQ